MEALRCLKRHLAPHYHRLLLEPARCAPVTTYRQPSMTMEALMITLTYTAIASLDGFIEDEHGNFDSTFPGPGQDGKSAVTLSRRTNRER